jgi:adenylate cyclase
LAEAQDAITGRLAQSLDLKLVEVVGRQIEQESAPNPDALDFVMRGRAWLNRPRSVTTRMEAQRAFDRALELDPQSVDAGIGLATALLSNVLDGWSTSAQKDEARAGHCFAKLSSVIRTAQRRIWQWGSLIGCRTDWSKPGSNSKTAIALDRNFADAYRYLGITLMHLGEPDAAIPFIETAIRLNPRDPNVAGHYWALGARHLLVGRAHQAADLLRRARAGNPRYWYVHLWLGGALALKGDLEEARAAVAEAIKLMPEINSITRTTESSR